MSIELVFLLAEIEVVVRQLPSSVKGTWFWPRSYLRTPNKELMQVLVESSNQMDRWKCESVIKVNIKIEYKDNVRSNIVIIR